MTVNLREDPPKGVGRFTAKLRESTHLHRRRKQDRGVASLLRRWPQRRKLRASPQSPPFRRYPVFPGCPL
jgi:hypothetical protein